MKRALICELRCPYCGGGFEIASESQADAERLRYGLLRCRCFEFPVVDGILLLSLANASGGLEPLQPYVALLAAAVMHLQKNDVAGLRDWMRRHMPLAAELLDGGPEQPYLAFAARLGAELAPRIHQHLQELGRYEVLGTHVTAPPARQSLRGSLAALRRLVGGAIEAVPARASRSGEIAQLQDPQAAKFYAPRTNALALRLGSLPWNGRVLSLRCGHGVVENLLRALDLGPELVSIDDQLLNLLIARRYANRSGSYILHDLHCPLPFRDELFDGVFAAGLPEIPTQKTCAEQAVRVTAATGWTFFDRIWNLESGVVRVNGERHDRFCQNFFARLEDYIDFFRECAGPTRQIGIDVPRATAEYRDSGRWMFEPGEIDARLKLREALELSALIVDPRHFAGFAPAAPLKAMTPQRLSISPAFKLADRAGEDIRYERRAQFARFDAAPVARHFAGYPERLNLKTTQFADAGYLFEQFCAAHVVFMPPAFDRETALLINTSS